jgi:bacteriocin biosynthesis cyclodehydratase domain-containing protein
VAAGEGNGAVLRLRPGAALYELSSDELQIAFPNYTATFTSPAVTKAVAAIVHSIGEGATREAVVRGAAGATGLEEEFVDYLVESLIASHCLAIGASEQPAGALYDFYAYVGMDVLGVAERLRDARCVLVGLRGDASRPDEALGELGLDIEPIEAEPGKSSAAPLAALEAALESSALVGCWNVPYRSPFARLVNELAARRAVPVLFGACEGVVGRVGPLVIPGNTACLECVTTRLLSHAGGPELRAYREYRLRNEETVPEPWPSHPLFVRGVAGFFGVELLQVALRHASPATGGFVEYRFGDFASERHAALRLPGCPACRPRAPRRLAWDARFPAPAVKGSAE